MGVNINVLRRKLLGWFRKTGRDLPWRKTHDAYHIVVSEVMLQQTQVDRVVPKYLAWLERFPSWEQLATAPQSEVVRMWSGLGYNRRALGLQKLARAVVERGGLPSSVAELEGLPGIGPYTARAIAAFAYRQKGAAPVDTNIERVLKRVFKAHKLDRKGIQALAEEVVPQDSWSWNHALMDLGATKCTARKPQCATCPLKDVCLSYPCAGDDIVKTKQSTFLGSDRFYRGSILKLLQKTNILRRKTVASSLGPLDPARFAKILDGLRRDGFIYEKGGKIYLRD